MEDNGSAFLLNNQSAATAMSALHAAANMMQKSPSSIHSNHLPFYPYVTPATLHSDQHQTPQVSSNSPQHEMATSVATPFGVNNILSPASVTMATMGGRRAAAAVAAQAAAMIFNNHHGRHIGAHSNSGMGQGVHANPMKIGKPLADLPGRPPIYWP